MVLALSVGPAASALCPHPGDEDMADHAMEMEHGAMGHAMPEAPACHDDAPQPEPESADCLSPCCVVAPEAPPVPTPPAPPVVAVALAPPVVAEAPQAAPEAARLGVATDPPGPPSVRLHLKLGRLLT